SDLGDVLSFANPAYSTWRWRGHKAGLVSVVDRYPERHAIRHVVERGLQAGAVVGQAGLCTSDRQDEVRFGVRYGAGNVLLRVEGLRCVQTVTVRHCARLKGGPK